MRTVQKLLGHKYVKTTMIYTLALIPFHTNPDTYRFLVGNIAVPLPTYLYHY
ncbi:MAG: hypothetical protein ACYTX0_37250 [Nostoc sp.]